MNRLSLAIPLLLAFTLLRTEPARACFACEGSEEECRRSIEEGERKAIAAEREHYAHYCDGKPAGRAPFGWGISTVGSFHLTCDGQGGGCLTWEKDTFGIVRNEDYTLGSTGSCQAVLAAAMPVATSTPADLRPEDFVGEDGHGNRVVYLTEEAARAHRH